MGSCPTNSDFQHGGSQYSHTLNAIASGSSAPVSAANWSAVIEPVIEEVIVPEVFTALLGEGGAGIQDVSPPLLGAGGAGIRNCSAFTVEAWMLQLAAPLQVDPVYQ